MSATIEESLYERVASVAREFERNHEQHEIAAAETTNDCTQERHQGKADAFELAARRLRVVLDEDGDTDA